MEMTVKDVIRMHLIFKNLSDGLKSLILIVVNEKIK